MRKTLIGLGVVVAVVAALTFVALPALAEPPSGGPPGQGECDHGNSDNDECRPDPQPEHGEDCEEHGPHEGGVNEDHCGPTPTPTPTGEPTPEPSPTVEPTPSPSDTPTPVPSPSEPPVEPTPSPSLDPPVVPRPTLPETGAPVGMAALAGLALLLVGLALRADYARRGRLEAEMASHLAAVDASESLLRRFLHHTEEETRP